jgi:tetratricopeptide (TPR) repeat protein
MKSRVVAVWVGLCLCGHLVGGPSALAQGKPAKGAKPAPAAQAPSPTETQAREAFERGRIHYDNGDFPKAAVAFEEAYRLSGRDGLLYNLYLSYRDANNQDKAAEALRAYLTKVEVIENRPQLEARLKALDEGIAQRKAAEALEAEDRDRLAREQAERDAAAAKQAAATPPPAAKPEENKKWWLPGVAVAAGGAALMLGSIGTGLVANSKASELEDKCADKNSCDPKYKSLADSGRTMAVVTDVLLFGGAAVVVVGGVLLLLKKPKKAANKQDSAHADVSCTRAGCYGAVSLRF